MPIIEFTRPHSEVENYLETATTWASVAMMRRNGADNPLNDAAILNIGTMGRVFRLV